MLVGEISTVNIFFNFYWAYYVPNPASTSMIGTT